MGAVDRLVGADGGIFSYGDAGFHGSTGSLQISTSRSSAWHPTLALVATGWSPGTVASSRSMLPSTARRGSIHSNKPVNGMASTHDGLGYWFVASDGGIFDYGDAPFHGSAGSLVLNAPIVGMAPDFATGGYWLLGSDGGIFSYDAAFFGAG